MVRRKTIRSAPRIKTGGEIQSTREEVMNRKRFQAIAFLSAAWLAHRCQPPNIRLMVWQF
jgi:hypothetical protein